MIATAGRAGRAARPLVLAGAVGALMVGSASCNCCYPVVPPAPDNYNCPDAAVVYCQRAQAALEGFLGSYNGPGTQIAHGETPQRLLSKGAFGGGAISVDLLSISTQWAITWVDACAAEMIVDYYAATGDPSFNSIVEAYKSFDALETLGGPFADPLGLGAVQIANTFNDDQLWWALAFVQAYEKLPSEAGPHDPAYLANAERLFQNVCAQWNAAPGCGGGVPQQERGGFVNTITNALFFQLAIKLYLDDRLDANGLGTVTGNSPLCAVVPTTTYRGACDDAGSASAPNDAAAASCPLTNDYLGWALAEYEWFVQGPTPGSSLISPAALADASPVVDSIQSPAQGCAPAAVYWSYNTGPLIGALFDLSTLPADKLPDPPDMVLETAWRITNAAMTYYSESDAGPALTERTDPTCNDNDNCPEFKGVFARYLSRLAYGSVPSPFTARAQELLRANADAVWTHRTASPLPVGCHTDVGSFTCGEEAGTLLPLEWNGGAVGSGANYEPAMTSALDALIGAIPLPSHIFSAPTPPLAGGSESFDASPR